MKLSITIATVTVLGALSWFAWQSGDRAETATSIAASLSEKLAVQPPTPSKLPGQDDRAAQLIKESNAELASKPERTDAPAENFDTTNMSMSEAKAYRENAFRQTIAAIQSQPRSAGWATATESTIEVSYAKAKSAAEEVRVTDLPELRGVTCGKDACVMSVAWPSYQQAVAGWDKLLLSSFEPNCDREIVLEDAQSTGPYAGQVAITNCNP